MNALPPPDPIVVLSASDPVTSLTFDDDDVLFSGYQSGVIKEWNLQTRRSKSTWKGHSDIVISLSCVDDLLISQGREGQIKIWAKTGDEANRAVCKQIQSATLIFCNAVLLKFDDSNYLAVPCDHTARIQVHQLPVAFSSSSDTQVISTLEPSSVKECGMCMKMCSGKKFRQKLLVGYESGVIALWDGKDGICLAQARIHQESVMCLDSIITDTVPDTFIGVSGSADKSIEKWTITNNEIVKSKTVDTTNPGFSDIKMRQDGRILISGGWDSIGRVFTVKKLKPLAVLTYHKQSVQCVGFAGDKTIVTGSRDGYIALWNVYKNT